MSVELGGFALMGGNGGPRDKVPPLPDAPVVRVRAFSLMGGVSVERKKPRKPRTRASATPLDERQLALGGEVGVPGRGVVSMIGDHERPHRVRPVTPASPTQRG